MEHEMEYETAMQAPSGRFAVLQREVNTVLAAAILTTTAYAAARWGIPRVASESFQDFLNKFVGVAWPFFMAVTAFLFYALGAWIVELFALGARRRWRGIDRALSWAVEACPLVGLLTTFFSLLTALLAYGEAGPGTPETQKVFISAFAIAFGSSIAGGVLALMAFTLHSVLQRDEEE
ncbi:MAG TPA: hypothetical protein ENI79_00765 [Rhodospirillales bacterium]|nr:hypothetical protein [Rhodospirillales bacterium]